MKRRVLHAAVIALTILSPLAPLHAGSQVTASKAALATPSPLSTQVGLTVLKNGGNAIDAAVAVAFALAVIHPHSANLGGGGYLTYYDAASRAVWTLDFRETAPGAVTPDSIADRRSLRSGVTAAGIPGTVAGLDAMHRKFGSRPWKDLLQPAAMIAAEGVRVDDEVAEHLQTAKAERAIDQFGSTAAIFFAGGKQAASGDRIVHADLAATITRLGEFGARDFYEGDLAARLIDSVRVAGGSITPKDLREYAPVWRAPLRFRLGEDDVYAIGPPSGGGMHLGIALNILGGFDLTATGYQTPETIHMIAEADRRASIDCAKYVGDPSTTRVPYRDLLSGDRASGWRKSIRPQKITSTASLSDGSSPLELNQSQTHFVVSDAAGNVASITTTLGDAFGGGFLVPSLGFFLNNSLRDFTDPKLTSMSNAIAPAKRPTDGMTSVMVLRGGRPFLAFGTSATGGGVNSTNLQVLLNVLIFDQPIGDAIAAPRYEKRNNPDQMHYERISAPEATVNALNAMGHPILPRDTIGNVQALLFEAGRIVAVADPRRPGAAGGY